MAGKTGNTWHVAGGHGEYVVQEIWNRVLGQWLLGVYHDPGADVADPDYSFDRWFADVTHLGSASTMDEAMDIVEAHRNVPDWS